MARTLLPVEDTKRASRRWNLTCQKDCEKHPTLIHFNAAVYEYRVIEGIRAIPNRGGEKAPSPYEGNDAYHNKDKYIFTTADPFDCLCTCRKGRGLSSCYFCISVCHHRCFDGSRHSVKYFLRNMRNIYAK